MAGDQVDVARLSDLTDVSGEGGGVGRDSSSKGSESIITRIRSRTGSSSNHTLGIHRTSTRESHQSAGSNGEGVGGLAGLISNTRTFFKRHNRSGSTPEEGESSTNTTVPDPLQAAGLAGPSTSSTISPSSNNGNESPRLPASASTASASTSQSTTDNNTELQSPITPDTAYTQPPLLGTISDGARSSSDNNTATSSSSSSIPRQRGGVGYGYSSSAATTVSDASSPNEVHHQHQQQQEQPSSSHPVASSSSINTNSRDFALPPGAAPMTMMSTEARYRALPRLQSYSVTHPDAAASSSSTADHDGEEYDTTTSMSGTETEHDDTEESDAEGEEEEEDGEHDDNEDEEGEDEDEHGEEDVRGGVNAMRTSLQRPALPTLSSTRGFSRSANTPGVSPTTTTSSNPFAFQGWTTFASSTPTPGPMRTARPQSGDNAMNGSYFDPRPSSSSSRASTVFQTPAQTPRGENGPSPISASALTSAGKARQQSYIAGIPTPGSSAISPPPSRIRMEGTSRPSSGSPLAAGRKPSAGTFMRTVNGQSTPMYSMPNTASLPATSTANSSTSTVTRTNLASTAGNRPSFYTRQSKSLVDLSRSLSLDNDSDEQLSPPSVASVSGASSTSKTSLKNVSGSDALSSNTANTRISTAVALSTPTSSSSSSVSNETTAQVDNNAPSSIAIPQEHSSLQVAHTVLQPELVNASLQANSVTSPSPLGGNAPAGLTTTATATNTDTPEPTSSNDNDSSTNMNIRRGNRSRNQSPNRQLIQRRQSMPEMRIDPPLYQIDDDFNVQYREGQLPTAREDEGREALPSYTCDVHIEGYVPRKMEFVKPGIQSKDRRWKRQYVILHGTSVKVYKSDPRTKAVPGEEPPPTPGIHTDKHRPSFSSISSKTSSNSNNNKYGAPHTRARAPTQSSISSASSMEGEKALLWNRAVQDAIAKKKYDPDMPVHVHLQEEDEHGLASLQHAPSTLLAKASENRCIRHYTLQGAESGLAADYLKRRHVVRVRAEGEQFLIQCKDDRAVIDWIEALQAATNTALDLDVRPLPKFITLPRRRRRRRPADASNPAGTAAAAVPGGTALASSTATPAPGATRTDSSEVSARSDAMNAMLAEDQDAYLGSSRSALG